MMGAAFLKVPDLALTEDESKQLAAAVVRVTELYDVPLLDEKTRAWVNLGLVGCNVYGTRIAAVMIQANKTKAEKKQAAAQPQEPMPIDVFKDAAIVQ